MQESGADFTSVVRVSGLKQWERVPIRHWTHELHAKFWGESMADEEREWRNSEAPIPAVGGDEDQCLDIDEDLDDDDIIPGCYAFDISVPGLSVSDIWIRADYIRIYDFFEQFSRTPSASNRAPAAVVTGGPGNGKSTFVYYALRRRLAEKKPVIWYRDHRCFLFVEEGVFVANDRFLPSDFNDFVWTLVDTDEANEGIPPLLVPHSTRLAVLYSTFPRKERWSRMFKTTHAVTLIMNPWTRKELSYLASTLPPDIVDDDVVNCSYDLFGPTPRLCIEYSSSPIQLLQYKTRLGQAIANATPDKLKKLFTDASSLNMDDVSDDICLIVRKHRDDVTSEAIVKPMTPTIQSRLAAQFRSLERKEQVRLYKSFANVPKLRYLAGVVFEALCHCTLQDGKDLELTWMDNLMSCQGNPPQWCSSHVPLRNATLEASRQQTLQQMVSITIKPSDTIEYTDDGPSFIETDVFYVPESSNQIALDSFIVLAGLLYIFQFTIGRKHDIKPGVVALLAERRDIPAMDKWRFVFIHPPNSTLICPQPWSLELRQLPAYSAVISL